MYRPGIIVINVVVRTARLPGFPRFKLRRRTFLQTNPASASTRLLLGRSWAAHALLSILNASGVDTSSDRL
jgi:hypothetical protein